MVYFEVILYAKSCHRTCFIAKQLTHLKAWTDSNRRSKDTNFVACLRLLGKLSITLSNKL